MTFKNVEHMSPAAQGRRHRQAALVDGVLDEDLLGLLLQLGLRVIVLTCLATLVWHVSRIKYDKMVDSVS